jgi:hypothetical protein
MRFFFHDAVAADCSAFPILPFASFIRPTAAPLRKQKRPPIGGRLSVALQAL